MASVADLVFMTDCGLGATVTAGAITPAAGNSACGELNGDSYTITYTVEDVCSRVITCVQTFTISNGPPTITCLPALEVIGCDASDAPAPDPSLISGTDVCNTVTASFVSDVSTGAGCPGDPLVISRTYRVTNECGVFTECVQTITIFDNVQPSVTIDVDEINVSCEEMPPLPTVTVMDNCSNPADIQIDFTQDTTEMMCPGNLMILRTWIATDECGNMDTVTQEVGIFDNMDPVFMNAPADTTVSCTAMIPPPTTPDIDDNCDLDMPELVETTMPGRCPGELVITRTFSVEDSCMNMVSFTQTITVVDTIAPTITCPAALTIVGCDASDAPAADISLVIASDQCSNVTITHEGDIATGTGCPTDPLLITRTYRATDECGNFTECSQVISIIDNVAPDMVSCPADILIIGCDPSDAPAPDPSLVSATDNCTPPIVTFINDTPSGTVCPGDTLVIRRLYRATDACGNTRDCIQFIRIVDNIAPTITSCPSDVNISCPANIPPAAPQDVTATDNCGIPLPATILSTVNNGGSGCVGDPLIITYTYHVLDVCNNATTCVQTVTVIDDAPPVITGFPTDMTVQCPSEVPPPDTDAIAYTDNCGVVSTTVIDIEDTSGPDCSVNPYTVSYTYEVLDACGNSDTHVQVITVEDITPPVLSDTPTDLVVDCLADVPGAQGITASDNCADIRDLIFTQSTPGACPGDDTITNTWTVEDCVGNVTTHVQTITIEDTTPPVLSDTPADITVMCLADVPGDPGITATDNCGEALTVSFTQSTPGTCPGDDIITNTWTVMDCAGNVTTHIQTITVEDTTPPVLSSLPADLTVMCSFDVPGDPGITATDNCGEALTVTFTQSPLDACVGTGTIWNTWTITDCAGNVTAHIQTVIVNDITPPVLSDTPADIIVSCQSDIPGDPGITATDNCAEALTVTFVQSPLGGCPGDDQITNTWTVSDCAGNVTTHIQTVTIDDNTPPVLNSLPADMTVVCFNDVPGDPGITATDNCGELVTVTFTQSAPGACNGDDIISNTWTVVDCAGNITAHEQVITISDDIAPIAPADESATVNCLINAITPPIPPSVIDNCGSEIMPVGPIEGPDPDCPGDGVKIFQWTYTDCAGNTDIYTFTYNIVDLTAPDFSVTPADITLNCQDPIPMPPTIVGLDVCEGTLPVTFSEVVDGDMDTCPNDFTITRTWTVEDCAGNMSSQTQVITVVDLEAPIITCPADIIIIGCDATAAPPVDISSIVATDNCGAPAVTFVSDELTGSGCIGDTLLITRTYRATDACGQSTDCVQLIRIVDDIAPTVTGVADLTVDCNDDVLGLFANWIASNGGGIATDNCMDVVWTTIPAIPELTTMTGETCIVFVATDRCGNQTTQEACFNINCSSFIKDFIVNQDADGSMDISVGDVLEYRITYTNEGSTDLTNVVVTDTLITPSSMTCPTLPPGGTCVLEGLYTVTPDDILAGMVVNLATGDSEETTELSDQVILPVPNPLIDIEKQAPILLIDNDGTGDMSVGDVIEYTIVVTNTGDANLTDVIVDDPFLTPSTMTCDILLPGEQCILTGTYTIVQEDVTNGSIDNIATGESTQTPDVSDDVIVNLPQPGITIVKGPPVNGDQDGSGDVTLGDILTFTIVVTNTGTAALTNVVIVDNTITMVGGSSPCAVLLPGETCTFIGEYEITLDDIDFGMVTEITNTATVSSDQLPDASDDITTEVPNPNLEINKSAAVLTGDFDGSGDISLFDEVTYVVTITNTGNANLVNVMVQDLLLLPSSVTCDFLAPGEACVLTGVYTIAEQDLMAGSITNTAIGTSSVPPLEMMDSSTVSIPQPNHDIVKSSPILLEDNDGSMDISAGDVLQYTITATNTGSANLTNLAITDPLLSPSTITCPLVLVGETCELIGTYTVQPSDLGNIRVNTASSDSDQTPELTDEQQQSVPLPNMILEKSEGVLFEDLDGNGLISAGDVIQYQIVVTNVGVANLTNITITDELVTPSTFTCDFIGPLESCVLTGTYIITQDDMDLGMISNMALGESVQTDPIGDTTITILPFIPELSIEKDILPLGVLAGLNPDFVDPSDTIFYEFIVTNTGLVTMSDIAINDPGPSFGGIPGTNQLSDISCDVDVLSPGEMANCSAFYIISQEDFENGVGIPDGLSNTATTNGVDPRGDIFISDVGVASDTIPAAPRILLMKEAGDIMDTNRDGILWVDDEVIYSFTVTNTGNTVLNDIMVTDLLIDGPIQCPVTSLLPGESVVCTAVYTITEDDVETRMVFNTAVVDAIDQTGISVSDIDEDLLEIPCPPVTCRGDINVTLPTVSDFTLSNRDLGFPTGFILTIRDEDGNIIPENILDCSLLGVNLIYEISHPCNPTGCWGNLNVDAKGQPEATATFTELYCGEALPEFSTIEELQIEIANRGCFGQIENFAETTVTEGDDCDTRIVIRTVQAELIIDSSSDEILIHTDTVVFMPLELEDVLCPQGIHDDDEALEISCEDAQQFDQLTPEDIFEITGDVTKSFPYIDHDEVSIISDTFTVIDRIDNILVDSMIFIDDVWIIAQFVEKDTVFRDSIVVTETPLFIPLRPGTTCNLIVKFEDELYEGCVGSNTDILRTWEIFDKCSGITDTCLQRIIITDDIPPVIAELADLQVSASPWSCEAVVDLILPNITDNCSDWTYSWSSTVGRISDENLVGLGLEHDTAAVTLTVVDACDNVSTESFIIRVIDDTAPVALSVDLLNATLATNPAQGGGQTQISAEDINQNSHDTDCGEVSICVLLDEELQQPIVRGGVHLSDGEGRLLYTPVQCVIDGIFEYTSVEDGTTTVEQIPYVVCKEVVKFCCENIGENRVALVVSDESPLSADGVSWTLVNVEDKSQATIACEDILAECKDDISPDIIGYPVVLDAVCSMGELTFSDEGDIDGCGEGEILRSWFLDGVLGCVQRITFSTESTFDPYTIKWPKHFDGETFVGVDRSCELLIDENGDPILDTNGDEQFRIVELVNEITMGEPYSCSFDENLNEPIWCEEACSIIASSSETMQLTTTDACQKIVRRWTVIDWCTYAASDENLSERDEFQAVNDASLDDNNPSQAGQWLSSFRERSAAEMFNGSGALLTNLSCQTCPKGNEDRADEVYFRFTDVDVDGFYTWDQNITVLDQTPPEIEVPLNVTFDILDGAMSKDDDFDECQTSGSIEAIASDMCGNSSVFDQDLIWTVRVLDSSGEQLGDMVSLEGDTIEFDPGLGSPDESRIIEWSVHDGCNNMTIANTRVVYVDTKSPTPLCIESLTTATMDNTGTTMIWASDFDLGSFDNCSSVDVMFRATNGSFVPSLEFTCDDIADGMSDTISLELYAIDESDNSDFCLVTIRIEDNLDACLDDVSNAIIAGQIQTPEGLTVPEVTVKANLTATESDNDGSYAFNSLQLYRDYRLSGDKQGDYAQGVTGLDLVLVQRHLLNTQLIEDPYKLIAADVNRDGRLSALDLVEIRSLILGRTSAFSSNKSWVFLDADYKFDDPSEPWNFEEGIYVQDLTRNMMTEDLIGIKLGDINGNVANSRSTSNNKAISLSALDQSFRKGEEVNLILRNDSDIALSAIELTLDQSNLKFKEAKLKNQYGYEAVDRVNFLAYTGDLDLNDQEYVLTFVALRDSKLSSSLTLNTILQSRAYDQDGIEYGVSLEYLQEDAKPIARLLQNVPNPFSVETSIGFYIPTQGSVIFELYDVAGRFLYSSESTYEGGTHYLKISKDDLLTSGVIHYKIIDNDVVLSNRMVLID